MNFIFCKLKKTSKNIGFAIISSFDLFLIQKMKKSYGHLKKSDWTIQLAGEDCTPHGPPQVQNSRPNLKEEIESEVESEPM